MAIGDIIVGIDIGASKVTSVIGEVNNFNQIEIVATAECKCLGMKKAKITDEEEIASAIRKTITEVENQVNIKINSAYVTIPGKYVNYEFVLNQYKDIKHIKLYDEKTLIDMALITQAEWELMDGLTAPCIPITPDKDCAIDFFPIRRLPILLSVGLEGWMHDKCAFLYEDDDKKIFIMSVVTSEHYTNRVINEK